MKRGIKVRRPHNLWPSIYILLAFQITQPRSQNHIRLTLFVDSIYPLAGRNDEYVPDAFGYLSSQALVRECVAFRAQYIVAVHDQQDTQTRITALEAALDCFHRLVHVPRGDYSTARPIFINPPSKSSSSR